MSNSSSSLFTPNASISELEKTLKSDSHGHTFLAGQPWPREPHSSTPSSALASQVDLHGDSHYKTMQTPDNDGQRMKYNGRKKRKLEEDEIIDDTSKRLASFIAGDHLAVLYPDLDTPFVDSEDVVNRLLPYHVFQQPKEDLDVITSRKRGKTKATETEHIREEITETKFALNCFRRRKALEDRFRRTRIRSGKRKAPDDQTYVLAQAILDQERAENTALNAELRNARSQLEKIEREKRLVSMPPRAPYYPPQPAQSTYIHHYRPYSYPHAQPYTQSYAQAYIPPQVVPTLPPTPANPLTKPTPVNELPAPTSAIPVQLPVSSLPDLQRIGINPVLASAFLSSDQTPPPAILRGYTNNGTMLSLDVNVGLLQPAQMSGLAVLLNSLMTRGASVQTASSQPASSAVAAPALPDTGGTAGTV